LFRRGCKKAQNFLSKDETSVFSPGTPPNSGSSRRQSEAATDRDRSYNDDFEFSVTSEVMAGVDRSFTSFSAAAEEATRSRIFAGVHFRFDLTSGRRLGDDVADFVIDNFLTSRDRDD
jgi:hypothetical protein